MTPGTHDPLSHVWGQAQSLPPEQRLILAHRLLDSLAPIGKLPQTGAKPADLIGAWKVANPPNDEEVERILDEARLEKFG
jgi:hypothetical protein